MTPTPSYADVQAAAGRTADRLDALAAALDRLGPPLAATADNLRAKAIQVRAGRFRVLVVGEFSRGKSTLLNAVLGAPVLTQKVTPSTAVVTVLRHADAPEVEVTFTDGRPAERPTMAEFLKRYELAVADTTEAAAVAERFRHVERAVIGYPVDLCRDGVELVDSPGLGDHKARSDRTLGFVRDRGTDAVVMVLSATQLFTLEEEHFLDAVLLPLGLRNVFFVVNMWNLIDESVVRPEDADAQRAELNARIAQRLAPFCALDGRDRSAERVFRVNALGALKARLRTPVAAGMLDESGVPAFEDALRRFLVDDRAKARADVVAGLARGVAADADRYVATQLALADRSVAEVEAERAALEPQLDRLRAIRRHTVSYLQGQSSVLQDRLGVSLHEHIRKVSAGLPDDVAKFDLSAITNRSLVWEAVKGKLSSAAEERFAAEVRACLEPQVQRLMERRFGQWHRAVVGHELKAVEADVDKHLQEEAAEYLRVLREIDERIGGQGSPKAIGELIRGWLGEVGGPADGPIHLPIGDAFRDVVGVIVATVIAEVVAEVVLHVATGGVTLIISAVLASARLGMREMTLRASLSDAIVTAVRDGLATMGDTHLAAIRAHVRAGFDGLEAQIGGAMAAEIDLIAAGLQDVIDRKRAAEYSAAAERARLTAAQAAIRAAAAELTAAGGGRAGGEEAALGI